MSVAGADSNTRVDGGMYTLSCVNTPGLGPDSRAGEPGELAAFTSSSLTSGTRIGAYEIIRELGRGGMGAVYLARDTKLGRRVAIKFLQSRKPELNVRFILEARATAKCNHENIVVIHDADEYQGAPYMVLEYLKGSPLSKLLREGRRLPQNRAVSIVTSVVRALECAHSHNIVHRDLKPDNIFITDTGTVKVLDFGIAKLMHEEEEHLARRMQPSLASMAKMAAHLQHDVHSTPATPDITKQGAIVGTLPYMSPEQWGADAVDHRTDLWAAGILLFRILAGKHPLHPRVGAELMITGVLSEPMPRAREVCTDIGEEVASIIDRCLIKPRAQRWASARELVEALESLAMAQGTRRTRVGGTPFAGLRAFQENDAARFYGRDREITAAMAKLQGQPLLGVVGPSGVGKSSFVRAGLVPALKQSGEPWSTVILRPGRNPVGALALAVAPMLSHTSAQTSVQTAKGTSDSVADDLAQYQVIQERFYAEPGYLGVILRSCAQRKGQRILVFVDQFEELYTLVADPRERLAFTRCLASAADDPTSPLRVVISIRSDFLDRVSEDEPFMAELSQDLFFLPPPGRAGLRDALTLPVQMADYQYENEAMVEHMLDHLEHVPGALPLLQFAATKLWDLRKEEERLLTQASYDSIGGITGALASHADSVLAELADTRQYLARAVFLRLVTPARTRAVLPVEELHELAHNPHEIQSVVDHLVRARLLVVQTSDSDSRASVEIVHESLIHGWPTLRRWLDETQDDSAFVEQVRNAARQWQVKGYATGLLWRGEAVEEARRWFSRYRGELTRLERAYLDAVFALASQAARRKRVAVVAVITCLSLLVAAGAVALVMIRDAQKESTAQAAEAQRQLTRAQVAEHEANAERQRAVQAREETAQANRALVGKNGELIAAARAALEAQREAEEARARAVKSKRRARRERKKAKIQAEQARRAEARARAANASLEAKLRAEQEHRKELKRQGVVAIIPDVEVK
ncbi:MAG: protein kinase [Proteobacteria bacterium]|nr:protein kinase [Pseudomonadota bacterium]